ncbi:glutathione S-transferase N-terminal domain-containing protein [Halopiger aswanensis]|uniref:Glutathione S-transferase-like protein n=1 Tax=Halopiger aswanensis TaxID=148449 RepID=A0A419WES1_9EURY|nr:glutathione S-transferase N-terminal domain-containing protein [Halopiger aswanensis]RKD93981.1 glutathione S-transferase-like protein [Halopiger aswanensis]
MLERYQAEGCPHGETVRETLTDLGSEDIIPFLVDADREETLYESEDIVDYLEEHYA